MVRWINPRTSAARHVDGTSPHDDSGSGDGHDALVREGYERHGGELYRFAMGRLRDDGLAQDAVQETVVRAWRAADRFDPAVGSLRTWLFAIMRNVIRDQAAAAARQPLLLHDVSATTGTTEHDGGAQMPDQTGTVADHDLVSRALRQVSADHREAIVETYLRDRPYEDVARELGVSVSTLRSRVFYGLKQLRVAMTAMGVEA